MEPNRAREGQVREKVAGRVFVVDDEPNICRVLSAYLAREGYAVQSFAEPVAMLQALNAPGGAEPDAIVSDIRMPGMDGLQLLQALRERGAETPVILMTGHATIDSAVEALRFGAFDYVCKPFDMEAVTVALRRAVQQARLQKENTYLKQELKARYRFDNIIGVSPKMQEVYRLIEKAANSRANVLVLGESGTGKELVARALHFNSARSKNRFVAVSCAALPTELLESELFGHEKGAFTGAMWQKQGRFELADGGTLFLDEIGDISPQVQLKLLRVLQEREFERIGGTKPIRVDVRLVAATNRNLEEAIRDGDFREDLYYRLRVIEIRMPALRERPEDVPLLVEHFLKKYSDQEGRPLKRVSIEAMEILQAYRWPGNIRELENTIEHAVVMSERDAEMLTSDLLPMNVRATVDPEPYVEKPGGRALPPLEEAMATTEKRLLIEALNRHNWNLTRAAEALGISFRSMRYNVKKYGLSRDGAGNGPSPVEAL